MTAMDRTESKLRYAEVMLRELIERREREGDDFQRSHEEAFLFHLHGVRDVFLYEIKEHHQLDLGGKKVTVGSLCKALGGGGPLAQQLAEIVELEAKSDHPLHWLKAWRHSSTHRGGVLRRWFLGASGQPQRQFSDPATNEATGRHVLEDFAAMLEEMRSLIARLRSDLKATQPKT